MKRIAAFTSLFIVLCLPLFFGTSCSSESTDPDKLTQDIMSKYKFNYDETLFTTYAWIRYAGHLQGKEMPDSEPVRMLISHLDSVMSERARTDLLADYNKYYDQFDYMLEYIASVFAVNSTPPPAIRCRLEELATYRNVSDSTDSWTLNRMREIAPLGEILSSFYTENDIADLIRACSPYYIETGKTYAGLAEAQISASIKFMRTLPAELSHIKEVRLIPNLLENANTEMGFQYMGVKYDIKGSNREARYHPHEFTHSLVAPSSRNDAYKQRITAITSRIWENVKDTPAGKSYRDPVSYFDETLVRVISNIIYYDTQTGDGAARFNKMRETEESNGWILYSPVMQAVDQYRESDKPFTEYFPLFLNQLEKSLS